MFFHEFLHSVAIIDDFPWKADFHVWLGESPQVQIGQLLDHCFSALAPVFGVFMCFQTTIHGFEHVWRCLKMFEYFWYDIMGTEWHRFNMTCKLNHQVGIQDGPSNVSSVENLQVSIACFREGKDSRESCAKALLGGVESSNHESSGKALRKL